MKRIFFSILILILLASIVTGIYSLLFEFSIGSFIYVAVMTPGNIIIPTTIGVLLFQIIKRKFTNGPRNKTIKLALMMCFLLLLGLISWSIFDIIYDGKHFEIKEVMQDFRIQFSGFIPAGFAMAISLPFIDKSVRNTDSPI